MTTNNANVGDPSERDVQAMVRKSETVTRIKTVLLPAFKAKNEWADYGAADAFAEYVKWNL